MIPVFVTRPAHQAAGLIEAVARRGFAPVGAPCLTLSLQTGPPLDLAGIGGFAVTSINGVTALAARTNERALPVYAVGEATAAEARRHGFQHLAVAAGDGAALADLIRETVPPRSKAILHAAGAETAFDLAASLEPHGIPVECRALYAMTPAGTLPPEALAVLGTNRLSFVLLMSPRTASVFGALTAHRAQALGSMTALCMSAAIARSAGAFPFRRIVVSERATQDSLLDLLEAESARV